MDTPGGAEGSVPRDERTAIAGEEHDENAPFDSELLDDDDAAAFVFFSDLGQVDGDLGRGDSDADSVEDTSCDQLSIGLAADCIYELVVFALKIGNINKFKLIMSIILKIGHNNTG